MISVFSYHGIRLKQGNMFMDRRIKTFLVKSNGCNIFDKRNQICQINNNLDADNFSQAHQNLAP